MFETPSSVNPIHRKPDASTMKKMIVFLLTVLSLGFISVAASPPTSAQIANVCNRDDITVTSPLTVSNNQAMVSFRVNNGCHFTLGLASYKSPGPNYDPNTVDQEVFFANSTGQFGADGQVHSLTVAVPSCFYQVDFYAWDLIVHFTPTNQYLGNLIRAVNAGTNSCAPAPGSVPPDDTNRIPVAGPTNTTRPTTTSAPVSTTQELGNAGLAYTGIDLTPWVVLGAILMAIGIALLVTAQHDKVVAQTENEG